MPDEKSIAHDITELEKHGDDLEMVGKHPEHAPQPGKKTPQVKEFDKDEIDESGNLVHDDGKDENDAK